jgi:hypothetical protein
MRAIVDIIADVVAKISSPFGDISGTKSGTYVYTFISSTPLSDRVYVGERLTITYDGTSYSGIITTITDMYTIDVTFTSNFNFTGGMIAASTITCTVNFHYGHPLEVVNELSEQVLTDANREARFPCIFLPMDFSENRNAEGYDAIAELTFILMTDTKPEYKAADRYTYSFDTVLYPLYDIFIRKLAASTELEIEKDGGTLPVHEKTDRLYWGKTGLYGNTANIFNDFIDAIEINKLKVKILKTC